MKQRTIRPLLAVVAEKGGATADHRWLETGLVVRGSSGPVHPPR